MSKTTPALQAYVRARRWSLAEAAQHKLELNAEQQSWDAQRQLADQAVRQAAGQQHTLLGHAQFRAGELQSRRHIHAAVAAELQAIDAQRDALQARSQALDGRIAAQREQKLLLERVLEQRAEATAQQQASQAAHAADALVAARTDRLPRPHQRERAGGEGRGGAWSAAKANTPSPQPSPADAGEGVRRVASPANAGEGVRRV